MSKKIAGRPDPARIPGSARLRKQLWPELPESATWSKAATVGFTTIPRVLSHILGVIDSLSKNRPLSRTYVSLWCRAQDPYYVLTIKNPKDLAFESGFSGQRAETTWRERMRRLRDLGFIVTNEGIYGEFSYVLILNPFVVVRELNHKGRIDATRYTALLGRLEEVGSTELNEE